MSKQANALISILLVIILIAGGFAVIRLLQNQKVLHEEQQRIMAKIEALREQVGAAADNTQKIFDAIPPQAKAQQQAQQPPQEDYSKVYTIPVDRSPVIGSTNAPVKVVAFMDFQCPYCSRFYAPLMKAMQGYEGKVNLVVKHFPLNFHPQAKPASKAALASSAQGKYQEMVTSLFENPQSLGEDRFKMIAQELGMDVERFMKDYKEKDAQWEEIIAKDMALGREVGVRGTPTFFINGRKTRARDEASFKKEFEEILKEAK